ncbi:MAG: two-component system chemotaxis response regulator CheB [Phenylobacterium sp.]|jgi:two-component system chemotaxis response regulator CheB
MKKIKVLIIDDSALIRGLIAEILSAYKDIQVVGAAEDPYEARDQIKRLNPDVLTLDIEMPRMNGITFLRNIMRLRPMPVIMISTLTEEGAPATLEALELGAIDFLAKPKVNVAREMSKYADSLYEKIVTAASSTPRPLPDPEIEAQSHVKVPRPENLKFNPLHLVAIGASTGGTEAIKEVITRLPEKFPPIVIAQHIPPIFSSSYAMRMDSVCKMKVYEAEHDQPIVTGCIYIAPGNDHLSVKKVNGKMFCQLSRSEPVNRHRPSVEILFNSVAKEVGKNATGILLTGMGNDGALGLLNMRNAGCRTVCQDQQTSVVWGMPKAAVDMEAAEKIVPLFNIADVAMRLAMKK